MQRQIIDLTHTVNENTIGEHTLPTIIVYTTPIIGITSLATLILTL